MPQVYRLPAVSRFDTREVLTDEEVTVLRQKGYVLLPNRRRGRFVLRKDKERWAILVDEVKTLLTTLGFADVGSGYLGENQIDAFGGFDGTFVVFDCTIRQEPGSASLRNTILTFAGKKTAIKRSVRASYPSYAEVKFVIATRDIDVVKGDLELANQRGIVLWSERQFEMYRSLYKQVGTLTRYWLLKELGASKKRIVDGGDVYYKPWAFEVVLRDKLPYYLFLTDADSLTRIGYVSRLLPGAKNSYQRALFQGKINSIAKYIEEGGTFQNNVIVSLEPGARFVKRMTIAPGIRVGVMRIPKFYATAWIIDGQHRVFGFKKADSNNLGKFIPVAAFINMKVGKQIELYTTINRNQKPVDANDIWCLYPVTVPNSDSAWISSIAQELNATGPLRDRIFVPGVSSRLKSDYAIKLASICDSLEQTALHELARRPNEYSSRSVQISVNIINEYFSFVHDTVAPIGNDWLDSFFYTNGGADVALRLLGDGLQWGRAHFGIKNAREILHKILPILKDPLVKFCTANSSTIGDLVKESISYGGRERISARIGLLISQSARGWGGEKVDNLLRQTEYVTLSEFETELRRAIVDALEKTDADWWTARVPEDVRTEAEELRAREVNAGLQPRLHLIDYAKFEDYKKIILKKDNWEEVFKSIFLLGKEFVSSRLTDLSRIRNVVMHSGRLLTDDEKDILYLFTKQLLDNIQSWRGKQATNSSGYVATKGNSV
jgi:DGQHR domain-containing protein